MNHAELLEWLHYEPTTGVLTWRQQANNAWFNSRYAGKVAGSPDGAGYLRVQLKGKRYFAQVLIWFYVTGAWPVDTVDHRDLDKGNNRWGNLREATMSQQKFNCDVRADSTTKLKGVHRVGKRYQARISIDGKQTHISMHNTPEDAAQAYQLEARRLQGEFAR